MTNTKIEFTDITLEPWCYPMIRWEQVKPSYDDVKDSWLKVIRERSDKQLFDLSVLEARMKFFYWQEGKEWKD